MKIYTKGGDGGKTSLAGNVSVSKSDDRIELLGTIDELSSHLGLAKVVAEDDLKEHISQIQRELISLMAGIADPRNPKFAVRDEQISALEVEIDRLENSFPRAKEFVLYGGCELSARLDVARAVCRRAERRMRKVALNYGVDKNAQMYINRLSDYLYMSARYTDHNPPKHVCKCKSSKSPEEKLCEDIVRKVMSQLEK